VLPEEHVVDAGEEAIDTTPPGAPALGEAAVIRRPAASSQSGCQQGASSCDGSGSIGVAIEASDDDRTPAAEMGYVIELAGGRLPGNLSLPDGPVRADAEGLIWFVFSDRDQDIDVTLSVRAMDLGGNLGEPATVRIRHGGSGGCSAGAPAGPATLGLVILAVAAALRRRRVSSLARIERNHVEI
jgi:MYXO-CTERM domain-containing protein